MEITEKTIDLRDLITEKAPRFAPWVPGFLIRLLNRILHVEQINSFLYRHQKPQGIAFADAIVEEFGARISISGEENISQNDRLIFASNHPLGGLDGIALISKIGHIREDVVFPVNDVLMFLPNLRPVFVPVNKMGSNAGNRQLLDETFAGNRTILYFPAGLCSRKNKGVIEDPEWKSTFIAKARKNERNIVPVYIDARNSDRFYRWATWRKRLGIKANIEQMWLVDEMYNQFNKSIHITIGKPIAYTTFDRSHTDKEWAQLVKKHVYELKNNPEKLFQV